VPVRAVLCKRKGAMHPIMFRIPLPPFPLRLWWGLTLLSLLAALFAAWAQRTKDRWGAGLAASVALGAAVGAFKFREVTFSSPNLPLYSYGVMLGVSLVVGWYLTLALAERDGLPKETMANCYVVTAIAAIVGSRVLYVVTNLDEFHSLADMFKVRLGGLVAYGGFLGGYLGSWAYLSSKRIRLLPWADVAVPSLASGLMITRIGCYLFGCDFGKRLPDEAPGWLKRMGTFPHWAAGTVDSGDGSPAFIHHSDVFRGTPLASTLMKTNASLPVHPTQIYESLVGLALLALLLWQRRTQKFRGQIFLTFVFAYGYLRFLLEILRDDVERGEYGPVMVEHELIPGAMLLMSLGLAFGIAPSIQSAAARTAARVLALVPPVVAWAMLRPPTFGASISTQLSTSQWIGLLTACTAAFFYAKYWEEARTQPRVAMSRETLGPGALGEPAKEPSVRATGASDEDDESALEVTHAEAPEPKKKERASDPAGSVGEGDDKRAPQT
jgi:phosphatidylglycerol:prolipoprotein diacylglycerol transferase